MALAAGHHPEAHGMYRGFVEVGPLLLVALVADLGLLVLGQHPVARGMDLVATRAADVDLVMAAALPADAAMTDLGPKLMIGARFSPLRRIDLPCSPMGP
jgi:hypothetical protein